MGAWNGDAIEFSPEVAVLVSAGQLACQQDMPLQVEYTADVNFEYTCIWFDEVCS